MAVLMQFSHCSLLLPQGYKMKNFFNNPRLYFYHSDSNTFFSSQCELKILNIYAARQKLMKTN